VISSDEYDYYATAVLPMCPSRTATVFTHKIDPTKSINFVSLATVFKLLRGRIHAEAALVRQTKLLSFFLCYFDAFDASLLSSYPNIHTVIYFYNILLQVQIESILINIKNIDNRYLSVTIKEF